MNRALSTERKFELIERAFGIGEESGLVAGTSLGRALLSEEMGGGLGWVLSVGRMEMPKCHFYAKTINGCFARARNAAGKGRTEAATVASIVG